MSTSNTHRAINAVWRIESAKIIAGLARIVPDVGLAEDLAQDALLAALEQWPEQGVPENPGAWLMAAAKHPQSWIFDRISHFRDESAGKRGLWEFLFVTSDDPRVAKAGLGSGQ
jgi:predicted RNA polymerase sigma factor